MTPLGYMAETPLRTASRIFGAVIITLALLVGISAFIRPTATRDPSIDPVPRQPQHRQSWRPIDRPPGKPSDYSMRADNNAALRCVVWDVASVLRVSPCDDDQFHALVAHPPLREGCPCSTDGSRPCGPQWCAILMATSCSWKTPTMANDTSKIVATPMHVSPMWRMLPWP